MSILLTLREASTAPFVLREVESTSSVALPDGTSLEGNVSLKGPTGAQGPQVKGITAFCSGRPLNNEIIGGGLSPYDFTITQANCLAKSKVAATNTATFTINKDGVNIGTIVFAAGSLIGDVTITTANVSFGEYITIHAPSSPDATLSDIGIIIKE